MKCIGGSSVENDDTNCTGVVAYNALPDGDCTVSAGAGNVDSSGTRMSGCYMYYDSSDAGGTYQYGNTGLRKVVSDWMNSMSTNTVEAMYGPIEEWDLSEITNMNCIFYQMSNFNNANISEWNTSAVTTMYGSTLKSFFGIVF